MYLIGEELSAIERLNSRTRFLRSKFQERSFSLNALIADERNNNVSLEKYRNNPEVLNDRKLK